jgi:DnaJ-class molecular chaperone
MLETAMHCAHASVQNGSECTLEVTLPPGVREGQKLRLRGKGGKGRNGAEDGDIYLHITLARISNFNPLTPVPKETQHDTSASRI